MIKRPFRLPMIVGIAALLGVFLFAERVWTEPRPAVAAKIAVVDTQRVFDEYERTKSADEVLQKASKRLEEQARALEAEIQQMTERLEKQRLFIEDEEKVAEMEREVLGKQQELRRLVETGQEALREKSDELSRPILEEIRDTIREISQSNGYDIVLEKQLIVLYHQPGMDLTDEVIDVLNTRFAEQQGENATDSSNAETSSENAGE